MFLGERLRPVKEGLNKSFSPKINPRKSTVCSADLGLFQVSLNKNPAPLKREGRGW
jgi:hypothetical protein